tara:strand:- start:218 stop:493 length:276 start_codon:yes stop_codon:yes gene_type:complete
MKDIKSLVRAHTPREKSRARTTKEDLIEQIVEQTTVKGEQAAELSKLLAVAGNTLKWKELDFAILLGKKKDPKVRNFTALVWWHVKLQGKK